MNAIIPVAGFGSRMRPHTHTEPKVLMQVAGKPMLDHIIDDLRDAGVTGVTLVVGYLGDRIEEHVRKHHGDLSLHFVVQQEMLGLGHAIAICKELHASDERLLIILGDTIVKADFHSMFSLGSSALAVMPVDDPRRFGTVELEEGGDRITALVEKAENPPTNLAIVGVYLLDDPKLLFEGLDHIIDSGIKTKNEFQLTDALAYMLDKGHAMRSFEIREWLDCGKPETLLETNRRLLDLDGSTDYEALRAANPNAVIIPPVAIGPEAKLEDCVIGPYVSMRHNVTVRRAVLSNCTVGKNVTIENALLDNSLIGEFATVRRVRGSLNVGAHSVVEG